MLEPKAIKRVLNAVATRFEHVEKEMRISPPIPAGKCAFVLELRGYTIRFIFSKFISCDIDNRVLALW
jgi:hypothetical protein